MDLYIKMNEYLNAAIAGGDGEEVQRRTKSRENVSDVR